MFDVDPAQLAERLDRVRARVAAACDRVGRDPGEIVVVAVTKGYPVDTLLAALDVGLEDVGENRVQEARVKFEAAGPRVARARRHMVGHLQRNKVQGALELFDWIQSVDSLRLAEAMSRRAERRGRAIDVLAEVNAAGEEQKHGFGIEEAVERARTIASLPGLRLRGVMAMAPLTDDESVLRRTFRRAREIYERIRSSGASPCDTLSMGMSNDYTVAVEEGTTMLRLGTVLFANQGR